MAIGQTAALAVLGLLALLLSLAVFRTSSMVRSALSLLAAMAAIGGMFLAMQAEFLGVLQLMMMATEMAIMAIFMVMYMMDPGGLGEMEMTHQKRLATIAGLFGLAAGLCLTFLPAWGQPNLAVPTPAAQTASLGAELLTRSMLIFELAGVAILTAMVATTALAIYKRA